MTEPPTAATNIPPDHRPVAVSCLVCDYDLRGLARDVRCPECGLPVNRSDPARKSLRDAPPAWLASLSWGARLVLAAFLLLLFLPSSALVFAPVPVEWIVLGETTLYATGVWLLTRPQARFAPPAGAPRLAARFASFAPVLSELAAFVPRRPMVLQFLRAHTVFFWVIAALLLLLHLRGLALRLPRPALARCCGAGGAAFIASGLIAAVDDALGLTPAAGLEIAAAAAAVVGCAAFVLSLVWCVVAFERARGASRLAWRE